MVSGAQAWAGSISFPEACWKVVDEGQYLLRVAPADDRANSHPGARLWNLDKLSQEAMKGSDSNGCVKQIFKQAVEDGNEYWQMIAKKYGCSSGNEAGVCPKAHENSLFLDTMQKVLALPISSGCANTNTGPSAEVSRLVKSAAPVIQKSLHAATSGDKAPAKAKAEPAQADAAASSCPKDVIERTKTEILTTKAAACLLGAGERLYEDVKDFVKGSIQALLHPIGTLSALSEFVSEFVRNPHLMAQEIVQGYLQGFPDAACMTDFERTQQFCNATMHVVDDLGLLLMGGGPITSSLKLVEKLAFKAGQKALATAGKVGRFSGKLVPKVVKAKAAEAVAGASSKVAAASSKLAEKIVNASAKEPAAAAETGTALVKSEPMEILGKDGEVIHPVPAAEPVRRPPTLREALAGTKPAKAIRSSVASVRRVAGESGEVLLRLNERALGVVQKTMLGRVSVKISKAALTKVALPVGKFGAKRTALYWTADPQYLTDATRLQKDLERFDGVEKCEDAKRIANELAKKYEPVTPEKASSLSSELAPGSEPAALIVQNVFAGVAEQFKGCQ